MSPLPPDSSPVLALTDLAVPQGVTSRALLKAEGGSVHVFAFGAGEGLGEHAVPFDVLLTVLDGVADITLGGTVHRLAAGEAIRFPPGAPHAVQAPVAMRMLLVRLRA